MTLPNWRTWALLPAYPFPSPTVLSSDSCPFPFSPSHPPRAKALALGPQMEREQTGAPQPPCCLPLIPTTHVPPSLLCPSPIQIPQPSPHFPLSPSSASATRPLARRLEIAMDLDPADKAGGRGLKGGGPRGTAVIHNVRHTRRFPSHSANLALLCW